MLSLTPLGGSLKSQVTWGLSILVPWLKGWDGGCCCGVGSVVLSGVSSGHMDHWLHEGDGCMALGFSNLICNKEAVAVLKFLTKQLTFYFLKCLSLKALESCAIFEQAPFQLDTSLATGLLNILYGWPPSSSALASRGSRFLSSKGRAGEEKGD